MHWLSFFFPSSLFRVFTFIDCYQSSFCVFSIYFLLPFILRAVGEDRAVAM